MLEKMFEGKKILILGGAIQHLKLVNAAKKLGLYTVVTDYLEDSPCKEICDESWIFDVKDVDSIVKKCKKENIDGVISGWLDVCQIPYCLICEKLGLPCYGTKEQFYKLTNKHAFKDLCYENNVGFIPEYNESDIESGSIEFPVIIKPVDSRGSRGQSICYNYEDLISAIKIAKQESSNNEYIIEKYLSCDNSFQVTYFFIDGIPYILRTTDGYSGTIENNLYNVALCSISPSRHYSCFIQNAHNKIVDMMCSIGYKNGPLMLQGFYDCGEFRFFDPGLRFPGVEYDLLYSKLSGFDVMEAMIIFSITGIIPQINIENEIDVLDGRLSAVLFPTISSGKIASLTGIDALLNDTSINTVTFRYDVGDIVKWSYDVNQRLAEIDILCANKDELREKIKKIFTTLQIRNEFGEDMFYEPFDSQRIL